MDSQQQGHSREILLRTDWNRCLLCQEETSEALQCPAKSKRFDVGAGLGYSTLSSSILCFSELNLLPMPINFSRLDEGNGMEATFMKHMAKWHKSCHTKFNITKLRRAQKKRKTTEDSDSNHSVPSKKMRIRCSSESVAKDSCFFCEGTSQPVRAAATFQLDNRVRQSAIALQDGKLLAKVSAGDLMAQEAKYHPSCLASLYKRAKAQDDSYHQDYGNKINYSIALAELLSHIDDARNDESVAPILKLADLVKLYTARLEQLGVKQDSRLNSTKLKDRILSHFPDLSAHREGRDVLFAFSSDVGSALRKACDVDYDDEAICLARAAKIVRRDMLKTQSSFTGTFDQNCQVKSIPQSLLTWLVFLKQPSV